MRQPTYTHDCDNCEFVASVRLNQRYDVWRCKRRDRRDSVLGDTLIARYGNDGHEYASIDSGVLARQILAQRDEIHITPALRAILIAVTFGELE